MASKHKKIKRIYPSDLSTDQIFNSLKENKFPQWHRFKQVNVWQTTFGEFSTIAIFDIYSQKFNIPLREARRLKFTHCVDALRQLEDSSYIPHSERNIIKE